MIKHAGTCLEYSRVYDSRYRSPDHVYRKRVCQRCKRSFTTREIEQDEYDRLMKLDQLRQHMHDMALELSGRFLDPQPEPGKSAAMPSNPRPSSK